MAEHRFDRLARLLAEQRSRRTALKQLGAALAAGVVGAILPRAEGRRAQAACLPPCTIVFNDMSGQQQCVCPGQGGGGFSDLPGGQACGQVNHACCFGGACNVGLACFNGVCMGTDRLLTAGACGGQSQACCANATCGSGLVCQGGTCVPCGLGGQPCCTGGTCSNGGCCAAAGVCVSGTTVGACGTAGGPCNMCVTNQACQSGACVPVPCGGVNQICCNGTTCAAGLNCLNGTCVACGPASCPTGCCDASGVCQPGTSTSACGKMGVPCARCSCFCEENQVCSPCD